MKISDNLGSFFLGFSEIFCNNFPILFFLLMLFQCVFLAFFLCGFLNIFFSSGEIVDFGLFFGHFSTISVGNVWRWSIFWVRFSGERVDFGRFLMNSFGERVDLVDFWVCGVRKS